MQLVIMFSAADKNQDNKLNQMEFKDFIKKMNEWQKTQIGSYVDLTDEEIYQIYQILD